MEASYCSKAGILSQRNTTSRGFLTIVLALVAVFLLVSIPQAASHSPLTSGDNESLATATIVDDPAKSWVIYAELHESGEAQYYRFNMTEGERIYVMLLKSIRPENQEFMPTMVLMGPELPGHAGLPDYVEVPDIAGLIIAQSEQPAQAVYEPFSPSSFYPLAEIDLSAPATGTYYIAVYDSIQRGYYGVAVGYIESFSLAEWLLIPINLISVYQWDGQSTILIFAPLAITLIAGLGLIWWKFRKKLGTIFDITSVLSGLLFLSSGFSTLFQMTLALAKTTVVPEIALTLVFAFIPLILGMATLRLVLRRPGAVTFRLRMYLVILAFGALFAWAGLLIGSALAFLASVIPNRAGMRSERK